MDLGRAYLNLRQYTQAVATFSTAVQLNPANATAQFGLGSTYSAMGNKAKAMKTHSALKRLDENLAAKLLQMINKE